MSDLDEFRDAIEDEMRDEVSRRIEQQAVTDDLLDEAAANWNTSDYNDFFADCRGAGHDTRRCGAIWGSLKDRGDVETGGSASSSSGSSGGGSAPMPSAPGPETVEQARDELKDADAVHLLVTTGCPTCQQAKEALGEWIEEGLVAVQNVQTSDKAADIILETGIDALPALVIENDGELEAV